MGNQEHYYLRTRNEVAQILPEHFTRVLEIGCASGEFRSVVSGDCEYWGVEPDPSAAENAKNKINHVLVGTYETTKEQLPDKYFDLVICNDVIEHMVDHDQFFQSIKAKMAGNCILVASVPNVRYIKNLLKLIIKKDWKYESSGILDSTHLRFFTKKSLIRSLLENDFEIEFITGLNCIYNQAWHSKKRRIWLFLLYFPLILIFGQDAKYLQFGVRVHKK